MEESIAKQKEALRKQGGAPSSDGFFTTGWLGPAPVAVAAPPACDRLGEEQAAPMIARAATESKIDPGLVRAVIRRESSFVPCAVSPKGAMGMMQLIPDTATRFQVTDPFDAAQNIAAGAKYLKELLDRFGGKIDLALAGYNAGPQAVDQAKGQVPDIAETRDYVKAIVEALAKK